MFIAVNIHAYALSCEFSRPITIMLIGIYLR